MLLIPRWACHQNRQHWLLCSPVNCVFTWKTHHWHRYPLLDHLSFSSNLIWVSKLSLTLSFYRIQCTFPCLCLTFLTHQTFLSLYPNCHFYVFKFVIFFITSLSLCIPICSLLLCLIFVFLLCFTWFVWTWFRVDWNSWIRFRVCHLFNCPLHYSLSWVCLSWSDDILRGAIFR